MDSKQYWDNKIIEWEDSMHDDRHNLSFIEKLASYFRSPVKRRHARALELMRPFVQGKTVLELGCGSGYFAFDLCNTSSVRKIIGVDISEHAIQRAKQISREQGLRERCEFFSADIMQYPLPAADITVGLGLLDYLAASEIESLFKKLRGPYFLFSVSEKKVSMLRYIHILYLRTQRCPKHFYYTREDMRACIGDVYGTVRFSNDKGLSFACLMHNLPVNPSS